MTADLSVLEGWIDEGGGDRFLQLYRSTGRWTLKLTSGYNRKTGLAYERLSWSGTLAEVAAAGARHVTKEVPGPKLG